jgi:hypothetical protein
MAISSEVCGKLGNFVSSERGGTTTRANLFAYRLYVLEYPCFPGTFAVK